MKDSPWSTDSLQIVLLYGDIQEGYRFIGPFRSKKAVEAYLADPRFSYLDVPDLMKITMQAPEDQA